MLQLTCTKNTISNSTQTRPRDLRVSLGRYTKSSHSVPKNVRHVLPRAAFRWTDARILKQRDGFRGGGANIVPICSFIYCLTQKYEILQHKPTPEEEIYKRLIHPWARGIALFRPVSLSLGIRAVMSDLRVLRGVRSFHSSTLAGTAALAEVYALLSLRL